MGTISVTLPSDGNTIDAADYNVPINTIVSEINGNLDTNNISPTAGITASQLDFGDAGVGIWWQEIARTTLSSTSDTITVSSIPARKYLQVRVSLINSGSINGLLRLNADSGTNYSRRSSTNGAADGTAVSQAEIQLLNSGAFKYYLVMDIINIATQEKLIQIQSSNAGTAGAANLPERIEQLAKWANTAAQISSLVVINSDTGDYASGSEVVVLGHD